MSFTYPDELPLAQKVKAVARRIYDADGDLRRQARKKIEQLEAEGCGHLPVCIAKDPVVLLDRPDDAGRSQQAHRQRAWGAPVRQLPGSSSC